MKRASLLLALSLVVVAPGCGDDDSSDADATADLADADPSAPDSAPIVYDANPNQPDAPPATADANPGVADEIVCGDNTCDAPQVCCVTYAGGVSYACTDSGACTGGASLACDGPEDCSTEGEFCCAGSGMNVSTSCVVEASCSRKLCRDVEDCDEGQACQDLGVGISVCN